MRGRHERAVMVVPVGAQVGDGPLHCGHGDARHDGDVFWWQGATCRVTTAGSLGSALGSANSALSASRSPIPWSAAALACDATGPAQGWCIRASPSC